MDAKTIEWIIFGPLIVGLMLVSWWAVGESHRRLDDPNDDRTLHLDQLPGKLALAGFGIFRVVIYRQSGNIHAEKIVTGSAQDALAVAMTTFRRARINAVHVGANSEIELRIGRLYHDHRGRAEGKKVGKAHITLIERVDREPPVESSNLPATAEPAITFQPIGITCDCGQRTEIAFAHVRVARTCAACGEEANPDACSGGTARGGRRGGTRRGDGPLSGRRDGHRGRTPQQARRGSSVDEDRCAPGRRNLT